MEELERQAWRLVNQYMPSHTSYQRYLAKKMMVRMMRTMLYELGHLLRDRKQNRLYPK